MSMDVPHCLHTVETVCARVVIAIRSCHSVLVTWRGHVVVVVGVVERLPAVVVVGMERRLADDGG